MLPTVLKLAGDTKDKIVLDLGCGDGFFTLPLSQNAKIVYGFDNSKEQIKKTNKIRKANVRFIFADITKIKYPKADLILTPFVLGYIREKDQLNKLFASLYSSLNKNGRIIGLIDYPKEKYLNNKEFGAIKKINKLEEGEKLEIELYNKGTHLVTLHASFHKKQTINDLLKKNGFKKIKWHQPIISQEGINVHGKQFWNKYLKKCDVAYFSAVK